MITDKDREELRELTRQIRSTKMDVVFFDYGWDECAEIIMRYVNKKCTESADQESKEAAEEAVRFFDDFRICVPPNKYNMPQETLGQLRAAILGETVKEGKTDAEKLAIAVKALESASVSIAKTDGDYDTLCVIRHALKEIQ